MSLILRTNKIKKTISFSSLNLFLVMILFSCTSDDLEIKNSSSVINQLKKELKLDDFSQKNFAKNILVNWESITTLEKEQLTIYEVQLLEKNQTTIESNIFQTPLKYGLIAIKKEELMHSYLIEAYSSVDHSLYTNKIDNLAQFTGTLSVYELSGKLIGQLVVFNGKSTNPSKNNKLTLLDETINSFYISKNTTSKVPSCNMTQFVQIINVHETRHYVPTIIVGTYTNWGYTYSTYTTTITGTYMSVPYPCGTDADYLHVPYRVTTYEDVYVDPCDILKKQMTDLKIKDKIETLKGKLTQKNEAGFAQKKDGTFVDLTSTTDPNQLKLPSGSDFIGSMHTHQDSYPSGKYREDGTPIMLRPIPIFSPKDVKQFLEFLINTKKNNALVENVYSIMISSSSVYQLRFTGKIDDVKADFDYLALDEKYRVAIRENKEELGFLKFLNENININGILLYEIKKDGSIVKKALDSNNLLTTIECQ